MNLRSPILFVFLFCYLSGKAEEFDLEKFREHESQVSYSHPEKLLNDIQSLDTLHPEALVYRDLVRGKVKFYQFQFGDAYRFQMEALTRARRSSNELLKAEVMLDLALTLSRMEQTGEALELMILSRSIFLRGGNARQKAKVFLSLGELYRKIAMFDKAEDAIRKGLPYSGKDRRMQAALLNRLAAVKTEKSQTDSSLFYSMQSLQLAEELKDPNLIATSKNEIGFMQRYYGQFALARSSFLTADSLWEAIGNRSDAARSLINLSRLYGEKFDHDSSNYFLFRALDLCKDRSWYGLESEIHSILSLNYKNTGDPAKSYYHLSLAQEAEIRLIALRNKVSASYVEAKFDQQLNESIIQKQKAELQKEVLEKENLKRERLLLFVFVVVSVLLSMGMIFLYIKQLRGKRELEAEKKTEEELRLRMESMLQEKNALLQEVNHRVKNNLQSISSLLYLQSSSKSNAEVRMALEDAQRRINSIGLLHELLYSSENVGSIRIMDYLRKLVESELSIYRTAELDIEFILECNGCSELELDLDRSISLGLIISEALSNAVKHAYEKSVRPEFRLALFQSGDRFRVMAADNGIGISASENGTSEQSIGIRLMDIFARKIRGELSFESENGTKVFVDFPLVKTSQ